MLKFTIQTEVTRRVHAVTISDEACYAHVEEGGKRSLVPLSGSALAAATALLASVRTVDAGEVAKRADLASAVVSVADPDPVPGEK